MFISGAVGMRERKGEGGDQEPERRFSVIPCAWRAEVKAEVSWGVMSRSLCSSVFVARGLGESAEKGEAVADSVLAHVRKRLGNVTSRSTEAL